jgi:hypothetical protein
MEHTIRGYSITCRRSFRFGIQYQMFLALFILCHRVTFDVIHTIVAARYSHYALCEYYLNLNYPEH